MSPIKHAGNIVPSTESNSGEDAIDRKSVTVSVVVPAYNAERTIVDCLLSILSQTMTDLEIVVCDDASTDTTVELVRSIGDHRIHLIVNETNRGPGFSRDRAIAASKGQWITVCDADDMFVPIRLESLLSAAIQNENLIVFDDLMICHESGGRMVPWRRQFGKEAFGAENRASYVSMETWFASRNRRIKPFFSTSLLMETKARHGNIPYAEDMYFLLRLLVKAQGFLYVPKANYIYRIMPGSATANPDRYKYLRLALESCLNDFQKNATMHVLLVNDIAKSCQLEHYPYLIDAIKRGNLKVICTLSMHNPRLVWYLFTNVVRSIPYYLHRSLHKGSSRHTTTRLRADHEATKW
jgi:succinoglycan biosynthesis protein ExoO